MTFKETANYAEVLKESMLEAEERIEVLEAELDDVLAQFDYDGLTSEGYNIFKNQEALLTVEISETDGELSYMSDQFDRINSIIEGAK